MIYETIEKNKPKVYSDTVDQICTMINKHKEKSEKKEAGRQRNKEKKVVVDKAVINKAVVGKAVVNKTPIVRKDTLEAAEEKIAQKAKVKRQGRRESYQILSNLRGPRKLASQRKKWPSKRRRVISTSTISSRTMAS